MSEWLLSREELRQLRRSVVYKKGIYWSDHVAQAQLKRVANFQGWVELDLGHPGSYKNQKFVVMPLKYYESLRKEAGLK